MRTQKKSKNTFLFIVLCVLVFINAFVLAKNETYKTHNNKAIVKAENMTEELEKEIQRLQDRHGTIMDMTEEIEKLNSKVKVIGELENQVAQLDKMKYRVKELEEQNARLTIAQNEYETKISELETVQENLYYPVKGTNNHSLNYVESVLYSWKHIRDYKKGVYDCSEMAAHLEWYLESKGIKAQIVEGKPDWVKTNHAWVFAYYKKGRLAIEATTGRFVYYNSLFGINEDKSYYEDDNIDEIYNSIYDIDKRRWAEYDWWNSKTQ